MAAAAAAVEGANLTLVSSDGEIIVVDRAVACVSKLIKSIVEARKPADNAVEVVEVGEQPPAEVVEVAEQVNDPPAEVVEVAVEVAEQVNDPPAEVVEVAEQVNDPPIVLDGVNANLLRLVLQYCEREVEPLWLLERKEWLPRYLNLPDNTLVQLLMASNYLKIDRLGDYVADVIARKGFRGKTSEQIRAALGLGDS